MLETYQTPALFYGSETRSAFSLEYSCASLIFVEYSCLDIFSAASSCFACISCSELLAFGSQVVFICVFAWKQKCYCGSWYSGKICILLQINVLDNLTLGNCFELSSSSCLSYCILQLKPINGELPQSQLKFGLHVWYL